MLTIRLRRQGAKKSPFYRIVVIDSANAREGAFVEILGYYNPRQTPETLVVDRDRLQHWLSVGARPSDSVRTLVKRAPVAAPEAAAPAATA
ncbi:MAG: 30S ribosomal protein S16 [Acidobacteria bacterium]|mgnify:CR=1 FL=1|nr:30S ribosomal protein S16 [Acidobacteriota bacterium]